ncbi:hypothetical protein CHLRE_02g090900v5 [Chlamydomonas reinhardtii]|uniref:Mitochondrial carrier protein n=1 Tax=Chlamydomonas reinhardtii TaxID=3055 RepID=A0A2K3E185_CHLRE|nr:uncharacterized protein CHLRE_02g090900v5 [Chlamydomonas reinhardtii]PNW86541.1 hypothetical protein CHLRE_02g090900v5 [Chlamydomonas reinhardtii]
MTSEQAPEASTSGSSVYYSLRGALAGPVAGVCSRFITYPPDTIKARLQIQGASPGGGPARYTGTWNAVVQIARQEGLHGFYRGFGAVALGSVPANMAYFGAYESAKAMVPPGWGMAGDMAVGAAAQLMAGVVFTPIDIVKERLQVAPLMAGAYNYSGPMQAVKELVRVNGPLGLLKGYWATNAVWLPWNILFIAFYEASKRAAAGGGASSSSSSSNVSGSSTGAVGAAAAGEAEVGPEASSSSNSSRSGSGSSSRVGSGELSPVVLALCSAGSASLAGLLTHPADVVKTRLQVLSACAAHARVTAWSLARQMWAQEGARVFMTGVGPRILQLAPGTALSWVIYEPVKRFLAPPEL